MNRYLLLFLAFAGCFLTMRGVWACFEAKTVEDLGNAIGFGIAGLAVLIAWGTLGLSSGRRS